MSVIDELKQQQSHTAALVEAWSAVLDHESAPPIVNHRGQPDYTRKAVTAQLLENTKEALLEERRQLLNEAPSAPANNIGGGAIGTWDPILISLVRRAMPNLIAYDLCGVQPMTGPTGLIFAMKSRYINQTGDEALFNEAKTDFSGTGITGGAAHSGTSPFDVGFSTGTGISTANAEQLGSDPALDFPEMAFSIDKVTVSAQSRALKSEYSMELAQDLKAIRGMDAETELANILSAEILTEINREIIRRLYSIAVVGAQFGTAVPGEYNLNLDSNGRWSVERFKGLLFQADREANAIAKETRRGRGNFIVCSSDVASALSLTGVLDYAPSISSNLNVDDTGNTYVGTLQGKFRVYIDPYFGGSSTHELLVVGYKGASPFDAGFFYCPYVPLQMVRAIDPNTFQPKIGFKTRYGMVGNPFWGATPGALTPNSNPYFRKVKVLNIN
jgi:hypothetical protein